MRGVLTYERRRSDQARTERFNRHGFGRCVDPYRRSVCVGAIRPRSAQDVVDFLQKNGYEVIVDKIGTLPLDQCDVAAVRLGPAIVSIDATGSDRAEILNDTSAYVVARC